jgi:nucleotide-binding universal stress UspA family protein
MSGMESAKGRRIVVGVDGSDESQRALRSAANLADVLDATLEAIAVWNYPLALGMSPLPAEWNPQADFEKMLTETVDKVFGSDRPERLTLQVREGNPAPTLLEAGEDALMIVVGNRGHGGFAGLLLGSVSAKVAEHAHCPVLVIHGDQIVTAPPTRASAREPDVAGAGK